MYKIDELIMYGSTGVCRVSEIGKPSFVDEKDENLYYFLEPLYQSGIIYAPVENAKVFMRPVITEEEANDLIDGIPEIHTEIYKNCSMQQLTKQYQSILDTHMCSELLKLTKSIREKGLEAMKNKKSLGQIDKKFMKKAEELLFGEFAAVLHIEKDEVGEYIKNRLEG